MQTGGKNDDKWRHASPGRDLSTNKSLNFTIVGLESPIATTI